MSGIEFRANLSAEESGALCEHRDKGAWREALCALLPAGRVSWELSVLEEHAKDKWNAVIMPDVVVFAECREDVVSVMTLAQKYHVPVTTRGSGVGYVGGCVPVRGGIVLSVARMNAIREVNIADGVVVVEPGVITKDLQDAVHAQNWFYPPDPASLKECSLGGNIATNAGGPRCLKYGVTRSYVLGLEVVLADGRILRCGGRTHKNKTGLDLVGLFCGSEGVLGVITEATLRIIPHPQTRGILAAVFPQFSLAADTVQAILNAGHLPSALEITDGFTLRAARAYLGENALPAGEAHLIVEIDGRSHAVAEELDDLIQLLLRQGATDIVRADDEVACESIWQLRREFSYSLRDTGMTKLNEDIVVPRSQLVNLVEFCASLVDGEELAVACFGHAGDGNIHTNIMVAHYDNPVFKEQADALVNQVFTWVIAHGGAITGEHGIGMAKVPWITQALDPTNRAVHDALKLALDEHHILNPDKMGLNKEKIIK